MNEELSEYESIKNWLLKGNRGKSYTEKTRKVHNRYMQLYCNITGLNPDELTTVDDIAKVRGLIATGLRQRNLRVDSVMERINALNVFWRCNGRIIEDVYGGIDPALGIFIRMRKR